MKRIEIEEMPHEITKEMESELIHKLKPPFNSQTESNEYYRILHEFDEWISIEEKI